MYAPAAKYWDWWRIGWRVRRPGEECAKCLLDGGLQSRSTGGGMRLGCPEKFVVDIQGRTHA